MSSSQIVLSVDIGATSTKAAALASSGELHFISAIPTLPGADRFLNELLNLITQTADRVQSAYGPGLNKLGVAVAGFLDPSRSHLLYNPNIAWLEKVPLRDHIQRLTNFDVQLEVDSNAAAIAEHRLGVGRGKSRFLCLTCGTGIGVGMVIDGKPLRFAYGCMGDAGHLVLQPDGPVCPCGGRGCAEILVSTVSLAATYQALTNARQPVSFRQLVAESANGDPAARSVLASAGEWLGIAAASLANTFFPDGIAIAGGLSAAGDVVLQAARRSFEQSASTLAKTTAELQLAKLGAQAPLIGAGGQFWDT